MTCKDQRWPSGRKKKKKEIGEKAAPSFNIYAALVGRGRKVGRMREKSRGYNPNDQKNNTID